ncbi:hypothetical protein DFH09DRAFT_1098459 [Mycena vulgaris]|nr:hypothetical protein DFH09DRAFT_1098459 [Mycena vulgaris]
MGSFTIPHTITGCWANSESAVAICCSQLNGSRTALPDSPIPECTYNAAAGFTGDLPDTSLSNTSSTVSRWNDCITDHFNTSDALGLQATECQIADAASTGTPAKTPTNSAKTPANSANSGGRTGPTVDVQLGRMIIAGILVGGSLLHVLSSAI